MQINYLDQIKKLQEQVEFLMAENAKLKEKPTDTKEELHKEGKGKGKNIDTEIFQIPRGGFGRGRGRGQNKYSRQSMMTRQIIREEESSSTKQNYSRQSYEELFPINLPSSESYLEKLKSSKQSYSYIVKQYMENFLKISNTLNTTPSKIIQVVKNNKRDYQGYTSLNHEKTNVLVAFPGCNSSLIKAAYDYGLLHSVYTHDGTELSKIPELYTVVKNYLKIIKAELIFVRSYSIMGEVTYNDIYQAIKVIRIGVTKNYILPDPEEGTIQEKVLIEDLPEVMSKKRSWGFKVIKDVLQQIINNPIWVNYSSENLMIITQATSYGNKAKESIFDLYWAIMAPEKHKSKVIPRNCMQEITQKKLCKILRDDQSHECKWCNHNETSIPEVGSFEDIEEANTEDDKDIEEANTEDDNDMEDSQLEG